MAKSSSKQFAIGVDYGTNSVRALVVDVSDGTEVATAVFSYLDGEDGILLDPKDPNLARQNPADYIEGFYQSVSRAVRAAKKKPGFSPENVLGIGVDTTGSTPLPVDADGMPLAIKPKFQKNLAAHAWLWKDHTGHAEAAEITDTAEKRPILSTSGQVRRHLLLGVVLVSKVLALSARGPRPRSSTRPIRLGRVHSDFVCRRSLTANLDAPDKHAALPSVRPDTRPCSTIEWGGYARANGFLKPSSIPKLGKLQARRYCGDKTYAR